MKLCFAPLTLFIFCSIGAADARIYSHTEVVNVEGDRLFRNMSNRLIKNPGTGKCIHTNRAGDIVVKSCTTQTARWDLDEAGTGDTTVTISNTGTNKCLNGLKTKVEASKCDNNPKSKNQTWTLIDAGSDSDGNSVYLIKNKQKASCIEISNASLKLASCNNTQNQRFVISGKGGRREAERIVPVAADDKCMKAEKKNNGDFFVLAGSCKSGSVSWIFDERTNQFKYNDGSSTEKCLDASNGYDEEATISTCRSNTNFQKWKKDSGTIKSSSIGQCLKLNLETEKINLRDCDDGDQFQFEYKRTNGVSKIE